MSLLVTTSDSTPTLYWLLGSSVQKQAHPDGEIFIACLQTQEGWCKIRRRQPNALTRTTIFSCDGDAFVMAGVLTPLQRLLDGCLHALSTRFAGWTKPLGTSLPLATLTDLGRSKSELLAENALLRQQLIVLKRQVKRPTFTRTDRILLVLLARLVRAWQQALFIVQPDTLLLIRRRSPQKPSR
jgi:hypothetical protein